MNLEQLKKNIDRLDINKHSIVLNGPVTGEQYCIKRNDLLWEVYYAERGHKNSLKTFTEETAACEYYWEWIQKS